MPEFRTRPDGTRYPLTPAKPKWPGMLLGAVALAVTLAAGGTMTVSSGSGATAARTSVGTKSNVKTRNRDARAVVQRLLRAGRKIDIEASSDADDCTAHSYGAVHAFFIEHPCTGLYRVLLVVHGPVGSSVLVAIAWVDMPDATAAEAYRQLVDRPGSGNITELNREGGRYESMRFTGLHYASTRDGNTVVNVQTEPLAPVAEAEAAALPAEAVGAWQGWPG